MSNSTTCRFRSNVAAARPARTRLANASAESIGPAHLHRPARFKREQLLLARQRRIPALKFLAAALVLAQFEDAAQVRLGQSLDLLGQARSPAPQVLLPGP
jgi:hypothetical protein